MKLTIAEQTLLKRTILLPKVIRYIKHKPYDLEKFIDYTDQYNAYLEDNQLKNALETLPNALQHLVRHLEQETIKRMEKDVENKLENAKKDYYINALKSFTQFKNETDKSMSKNKPTINKNNSDLSKDEMEIIKKIKSQ